jgi:hypothetical protein
MTRVARLAGLWSLVVAVTASTALLIPGCATEKSSHTPAPAPTPTPPPPTPTPDAGTPAPQPAVGFVTSPTNGEVFTGVTTQIAISVVGTYTGTAPNLSVQVLSDPTDLTSWTVVGAAAVEAESFSATVGPFDNVEWPQGGVLRLRVVDGNGTALAYEDNNDLTGDFTTIVVGSPGQNPTDWQFLTQKPPGTVGETALYYQQINAPATLSDFRTTFAFSGAGVEEARYYNRNDLGIARDAQCTGTTAGGVACLVDNFGSFGGSENNALDNLEHGSPSSTFAIVYTPPATSANAVTFMVYDANGRLADSVQLDTAGNNVSVPQVCLNCHGGQATYDPGSHTATGATLLQFDPLVMDFPTNDSNLTFSTQEASLYQLDQLVAEAAPTAATTQLVQGEWLQEGSFNNTFVPGAWNTNSHDANLYTQVVAPLCRGCHASVASDAAGLTFQTPQDMTNNADKVAAAICGAGPTGMPVAQQTSSLFFTSNDTILNNSNVTAQVISARALLLEYLGEPGSCAQGQPTQ